jgi:hypothetical protein
MAALPADLKYSRTFTEDRGQKTEDRRQRTEKCNIEQLTVEEDDDTKWHWLTPLTEKLIIFAYPSPITAI